MAMTFRLTLFLACIFFAGQRNGHAYDGHFTLAAENVAANEVKVLGRLPDTAVAKQWPGHDVLDIPNWTPAKNAQWVDAGVKNGQAFTLLHRKRGT
ncbi:MAG: repeat protein [Verrucomicrobia bacterium]|nr:repeat protein [Verrucomicrobiota bacterium]